MWGQILFKDNNFVPLSYLIFYLFVEFILFFLNYSLYYSQQISFAVHVFVLYSDQQGEE